MIWRLILLLCAVTFPFGDGHHAISEQRVVIHHSPEHKGHHGELAHIGLHEPEHHKEYAWSYPSYEFAYKVEDHHTGDIKGQEEHRDGDVVKGKYWLIQPDGHKRIVNYHADKHTGFKAQVSYEPVHYPVHHAPIKHHIPHHPHIEHVVHKIEHHEPRHHVPEVVEHHEPIRHHVPHHPHIEYVMHKIEHQVPRHHLPEVVEHHEPIRHLPIEYRSIEQHHSIRNHEHEHRHNLPIIRHERIHHEERQHEQRHHLPIIRHQVLHHVPKHVLVRSDEHYLGSNNVEVQQLPSNKRDVLRPDYEHLVDKAESQWPEQHGHKYIKIGVKHQ